MQGKPRLRRNLRFFAGTVTAVAAMLVAAAIPSLAAPAASSTPADQPKPGKISEQDLIKLRQLEVQSGVRTKAAEAPTVQTIKGPPLSDREKVVHVLNRLAFGPRPGQVDKVLAEGGWEKWVDQQLPPDSVNDAALDDELPQKFPWVKMTLQQIKEKYPLKYQQQYHPELRTGLRNEVLTRAVESNRQFKEV